MKQVLLFCLVAFSFTAKAQNFDNAGDYMDYINKQQDNVSKKFLSYTSASAHGKRARKVENLRSKLMNEVQESKMNINSMPSHKGDKAYRDSAVSFMKLYYDILNEDYSKIINMEDIAEQSYDDMEAYMMAREMVDKKLQETNDMMKEAQRSFASQNNINLIDGKSEMDEMLKQVSEMNKYYKVIYLVFFKAYKQESYLMEAIGKANITGIEQSKNSLAKYAAEGLDKLKEFPAFKGDNTLVVNCRYLLNFYVKEAEKMAIVSDFFLTKERFETIKKEYDKKSRPGKEDTDAYNEAVKNINKASDAYNNNNDYLNQSRREARQNWNNTVDEFFDQHTPHYK